MTMGGVQAPGHGYKDHSVKMQYFQSVEIFTPEYQT